MIDNKLKDFLPSALYICLIENWKPTFRKIGGVNMFDHVKKPAEGSQKEKKQEEAKKEEPKTYEIDSDEA